LYERESTIPYEFEGILGSAEFSPKTYSIIIEVEDYAESETGHRPLTHLYECPIETQRWEEKTVFNHSSTIVGCAKDARVVLLWDNSYIPPGSRDPSLETRTWLWLLNLGNNRLKKLPIGRFEFDKDVGSFGISDDGKIVFLKSKEDKNIGTEFPFRVEEHAGLKIYFLEARNFVDSARFTDKFVISPYNDIVFVPLAKDTREPKGRTCPIRVLAVDLKQNRVIYSFNTLIIGRYWFLIGWYK
jgi:hypothetical protein